MAEFLLLTQDACPDCDRLKQMLARPLKGRYDGRIEVVHRTMQPEVFAEQVARHHLRRAPALIHPGSGALLTDTRALSEVIGFLDAHSGV